MKNPNAEQRPCAVPANGHCRWSTRPDGLLRAHDRTVEAEPDPPARINSPPTMRSLLFLALFLGPFGGLLRATAAPPEASLQLFSAGYPRAFFFRQSERAFAAGSFDTWSHDFEGLMGIMGKALDEEVPGRGRNVEFFTRFKATHPTQVVLLHINGNARDPRFEGQRFFAGHWLYHNGATVTANVPASPGETVIAVADATLFEVNGGR